MSSIPGDISTKAILKAGQKVSGALTASGDSDWYRVSLKAGYDYGFKISGGGTATALVGGDIFLRDEDGTIVAQQIGYGTTSLLITSIKATGAYYLDIREVLGATGNYVLAWVGNDTVARDITTRATLSIGQTVRSALDVSTDSDWYKVELKSGLSYGFKVSGDGSASTLVGGDIFLRDSDGNSIARSNNSQKANVLTIDINSTGDYYLDVREVTDGLVGNYKLSWIGNDTVFNNISTKAVLRDGISNIGTIDVEGDSDWFGFYATKGTVYEFSLTGTGASSLDYTLLKLRDADGNTLVRDSSYAGKSVVEWTADNTGKFYLDVSGLEDEDGGTFKLSVISSASTVRGTAISETITGGITNTKIYGYGGNDTIHGGAGNDTLIGGVGQDRLVGGDDTDTASYEGATKGVVANLAKASVNTNDAKGDTYSSIENLTGSSYADTLTGNSAANRINGGGGNDKLYGGLGKDVLVGGSGKDIFVFDTKLGSTNIDTVNDFVTKDDTIWLDDDIFTKVGKVGDLAGSAFYVGPKAHDLNDRIIYDKTTGRLWYDADGTGAGKAIHFATLDKSLNLAAADFDIIA